MKKRKKKKRCILCIWVTINVYMHQICINARISSDGYQKWMENWFVFVPMHRLSESQIILDIVTLMLKHLMFFRALMWLTRPPPWITFTIFFCWLSIAVIVFEKPKLSFISFPWLENAINLTSKLCINRKNKLEFIQWFVFTLTQLKKNALTILNCTHFLWLK